MYNTHTHVYFSNGIFPNETSDVSEWLQGLVVEGGGERNGKEGNVVGMVRIGLLGREATAGRGGRPKFGIVGPMGKVG